MTDYGATGDDDMIEIVERLHALSHDIYRSRFEREIIFS